MGMLVGIVLVLAIVALFFMYGLPMLRQSATPQVNVPSQIDVNLNPGQGGQMPGGQGGQPTQ